MKRLILSLVTAFSILAVPAVAGASNPFDPVCNNAGTGSDSVVCQQNPARNPITGQDGVLMKAVNIIAWIIGISSVIIIILSGLKYITANGDANSIKSAKNTLLYAIIGLVIFMLSQSILYFVVGRL